MVEQHIEYINNQEEFTVERWLKAESTEAINELMNIKENYDLIILNSSVWENGLGQNTLTEISKATNLITIGNDERNASLIQKSTKQLSNVNVKSTIASVILPQNKNDAVTPEIIKK